MISEVRARIRASEIVVFLGFGYYKPNLQLIAPGWPNKIRWILGTGFGLSDKDRNVVERERLAPWFKSNPPRIEITKMKCAELLNHYRMALSA